MRLLGSTFVTIAPTRSSAAMQFPTDIPIYSRASSRSHVTGGPGHVRTADSGEYQDLQRSSSVVAGRENHAAPDYLASGEATVRISELDGRFMRDHI